MSTSLLVRSSIMRMEPFMFSKGEGALRDHLRSRDYLQRRARTRGATPIGDQMRGSTIRLACMLLRASFFILRGLLRPFDSSTSTRSARVSSFHEVRRHVFSRTPSQTRSLSRFIPKGEAPYYVIVLMPRARRSDFPDMFHTATVNLYISFSRRIAIDR
jgi:hypothetical protein